MFLFFICLSILSCSSSYANPFFNVMYSDSLDDADCNGTSTWTDWNEIQMSTSFEEIFKSVGSLDMKLCEEELGTQVRFQSDVPMFNFPSDSSPLSYFYQMMNFFVSVIPSLKLQVRFCCTHKDTNSTMAAVEDNLCDSSFHNQTTLVGDKFPMVIYEEDYKNIQQDFTPNYCAGVMLDASHVLTYASCINATDGPSRAVIFHKNLQIPVSNISIHPEYNHLTNKNNLAIVHLSTNSDIRGMMCLRSTGSAREFIYSIIGTKQIFNISDPYETISVQEASHNDCPGIDQNHQFCVIENEYISYQFRNATPDMIFHSTTGDHQHTLTGMFHQRISVPKGFALVYTRIEPYISWIHSIIRKI